MLCTYSGYCWPDDPLGLDVAIVLQAKKAKVEVELDEVPYMPHAFQWCTAFLPEAREADDRIVQWMLRKLSKGDKN